MPIPAGCGHRRQMAVDMRNKTIQHREPHSFKTTQSYMQVQCNCCKTYSKCHVISQTRADWPVSFFDYRTPSFFVLSLLAHAALFPHIVCKNIISHPYCDRTVG